jgi:hypothetical protein
MDFPVEIIRDFGNCFEILQVNCENDLRKINQIADDPGMEQLSNFWDFTDPFVAAWQSVFHLPDDMMRLSISLFATFPVAAVYRFYLKSTTIRQLYSLFFGLIFFFFCFKWETLYFLATGILTYIICAVAPAKQAPRLVLLLTFGVLSYG